jgi:hypothetical protein
MKILPEVEKDKKKPMGMVSQDYKNHSNETVCETLQSFQY